MLMSFDTVDESVQNVDNIITKTARVIFGGERTTETLLIVSQQAPQRLPMILSQPSFASQVGCIVVEMVDSGMSTFERCEEVETAFLVCFENLFGSAARSRIGLSTNKSIQQFLHNLSATVVSSLGQRWLTDTNKSKIHNAATIVMEIAATLQRWLPLEDENVVGWHGCHVLCFVLEMENPRLFDSTPLPPAFVVFLERVFEVVLIHERKSMSYSPPLLFGNNMDSLMFNVISTIDMSRPSNWITYSPVWRKVRHVIGNLNELLELVAQSPSSPWRSPLLKSW